MAKHRKRRAMVAEIPPHRGAMVLTAPAATGLSLLPMQLATMVATDLPPETVPKGCIPVSTWFMTELLQQTSPNLCLLWGLNR